MDGGSSSHAERHAVCRIDGCDKKPCRRCPRCGTMLYCSGEHRRKDWKLHKKKCAALLKEMTGTTRRIDLIEIAEFANTIFHKQYFNEDAQMGFWSFPVAYFMETDNERVFFVLPLETQDPQKTKEQYLQKNLSINDYWAVKSIGKDSVFGPAFVSAIRLLLLQGKNIMYGDEGVAIMGAAKGKSHRPCKRITIVTDWQDVNEKNWTKDESHKDDPVFIWFRTEPVQGRKRGSRYYMDFTAMKYSITDTDRHGSPLWIANEDVQRDYSIQELYMPSDVDKILWDHLHESASPHNMITVAISNLRDMIIKKFT